MKSFSKYICIIFISTSFAFCNIYDVFGQIVHRDDLNLKEGTVTQIITLSGDRKIVKVQDAVTGTYYESKPTRIANLSIGSNVHYSEVGGQTSGYGQN
ncbi:hypothetical protein JYT51_01300, partial [Candidatus Amoebophilus asiaticus]|nr:hypothetical protein [Candidatus Amoebophilus asiaticus]